MLKRWLKSAAARCKAALARLRGAASARVGWYAGLALLLTALGTASYVWRSQGGIQCEQPGALPDSVPIAVMAAATASPVDALTTLPSPAPTREPVRFEWPVKGEIIGPYSPEALIWSETMAQWETHPAIDIAAAAGESVRACAAGVVADAYEDPMWGRVIRIEHEDGYASTYANLSTLKLVNVGDAVASGQTISAVGRSAACEAELPWHLHFALERDGVPMDFEKNVRQSGD